MLSRKKNSSRGPVLSCDKSLYIVNIIHFSYLKEEKIGILFLKKPLQADEVRSSDQNCMYFNELKSGSH